MAYAVCDDTAEVSDWYRERIRRFGYDARAVGFREQTQRRRFEALCRVGPLDGRSLLDVGCGLGDFLAYTLQRGIRTRYRGLDLCPDMVDYCRRRFAGAPAELGAAFDQADLLDHVPERPYDFVVASGIFGLKSRACRERIQPTLERLFSWCGAGMAVNFLSARAVRHADHSLYVDPAEILRLGLALTPAARLDHDYLPNDFTLYLYRTTPSELWDQGGTI